VLVLLACTFFALAGQFFLPLLGVEDDESLFASPLLAPRFSLYALRVGHSRFPLMVMSYIGTLKTLLYSAVFRIARPGVWSAREPMILAGAASVWIFYLLLRRAAGPRAAVVGAFLLATDSCYLLTTVFDWGPVALQHLILLGGGWLLVRFAQEPKSPTAHRALAGGFFLLGLAIWDKALAIWMVSGMAVAAAAFYGRPLARLATRRRAAIAVLAFALGSAPLLVFNFKTHWSTFRGNVKRDTSEIAGKARMLMNTVNGQGLFGYLTDEDWQTPHPHAPARAAAALAEAAGHPRHTLMFYAFLFALVLAPLAPADGRRAIAFCLVAGAIAWVQMAVTANTGASVHHTILLWPLPQAIVAISFAGAAARLGRAAIPALAIVLGVVLASNLLVANEYFFMMSRDGGSESWSDAIVPLSARLESARPPAVFCADWGIQDSLRLLSRGRLPTWDVTGGLANPAALADPAYLFTGRTADHEIFRGTAARLAAAAEAAGYRREVVDTIADSFGRPTFEVYRFVRASR
jgi:hypothetical protein